MFSRLISSLSMLTIAGSAYAQATIYTDEALFMQAAGAHTTDSFEQYAPFGTKNGGKETLYQCDDFTVESSPSAIKIFDFEWIGNHSVSGVQYMTFDTDISRFGANVTLTFNAPITEFGFYFIDTETEGSVTVNGITYKVSPSGDDSEIYFGVISDVPFTTVSFDAGWADSHWSIDDVTYSSVLTREVSITVTDESTGQGIADLEIQRYLDGVLMDLLLTGLNGSTGPFSRVPREHDQSFSFAVPTSGAG